MSRPRFAFFLTHPVQYISPMLQLLAQKADVITYYFSDAGVKGSYDKGFGQRVQWDVPLLEGYRCNFLKNYSPAKTLSNRFFELINPGVVPAVRKESAPIVITNGWMYCSIILTIITAKLFGKQVWLRAENPLHQELRKRRWVLAVKKLVLGKLLFPLADKFLYIGTHNKAFFEFYGAAPHQLLYTPYCVDNNRFAAAYEKLRHRKAELRKELGIPEGAKIILSTAKYITPKRPMDLLAAFRELQSPNNYLLMVGDGPLRPQMEQYIRENTLNNVRLTGFVNQLAISTYYAIADVFVLCSGMGETWGLSANEAMNFALPVCISKTCGCSIDLVVDGENGFIFNEGDVAALAESLRKLLNDDALRQRAGAAAQQRIRNFSIDTIVANLCAAADGYDGVTTNQSRLEK